MDGRNPPGPGQLAQRAFPDPEESRYLREVEERSVDPVSAVRDRRGINARRPSIWQVLAQIALAAHVTPSSVSMQASKVWSVIAAGVLVGSGDGSAASEAGVAARSRS